MMKRRDVAEQRTRMMTNLRAEARQHPIAADSRSLSVRKLADEYELNVRTVSDALKELAGEGVLYTVPRVGTFLGRPPVRDHALFLLLFRRLDSGNAHCEAIRAGFQERVARLGGRSLIMDAEMGRRFRENSQYTAPAGVFAFQEHTDLEALWPPGDVPQITFGTLPAGSSDDAVYFDNFEGGRQATRHLLALGHKRIAFLAMHDRTGQPAGFAWSRDRETGWRAAMAEAKLPWEDLVFLLSGALNPEGEIITAQVEAAREGATKLVGRTDITAVVVVNGPAGQALFQALRAAKPPSDWPAVVGFDTELLRNPDGALHVTTTLQLNWDDIGREAASALWERASGKRLQPLQRLVPMTLIPRLSCSQDWGHAPLDFNESSG